MAPTPVVDLTIAVFLCIIFIRRVVDRSIYKNNWQPAYCLLLILLLVIDALSLTLTGPDYPKGLKFVLSVISMFGAGLCIIAYTFYSETLLRENTGLNLRIFRILEIVEVIWMIALIYEGFSNHIITFPDGIVNFDYSYPLYIDIIEFLILAAVPLIAIVFRKRIGTELAVLFSLFAVGPILATVLFSLTDIDLSYALPALTFLLMDEFIQKKHVSKQNKMLQEALTFTNFFLDTYVSAYYVNLNDLSCQVYKRTDELDKKYPITDNYLDSVTEYINRDVHPEDRKKLLDAVQPDKMREGLKDKNAYSLIFRDVSDGVEKIYRLQMIRGSEEDHAAFAFIDITEEIREQRERLREADEAKKLAESANKSKTEFLFNMSHDIRTPLNAITGFTHMAIKHIDDREKVLDCLDKTQRSGSMLLSLINSVLEVSRIESGHATLEEQYGDVLFSFVNIENTMQEMAKTKDIDLSFAFDNIKDRYVYADFSRCMRIFVNIISNAVKYTPEGGTVKVRCEQLGEAENGYGTYRYTVTDNGIGMSEEFQKHIFEQFAREETSTVSGIQGSGLGMTVVKSFTELMGGSVSVQSRQGEGTEITVILPFRIQASESFTDPVSGEVVSADSRTARAPEHFDFSDRKGLVVEDNELNREIAVEILEEEGLEAEEAEDGTEAVKLLKEKGPDHYDFILMDIQMPVMNGYEATRAIRAMYPDKHIPIIALSANAFAEDKKKSLEAGMDDHVAKPINAKELFSTLAKFL